MSLRTVRCALVREVRTRRSCVVFDAASAREPELAAFGSPSAALSALADEEPATLDARERAIAAILREHRADPQTLWSALLLVACMPMLAHLCAALRGGTARDETEQTVVAAFLEAAARARLAPGRTSAGLRSATARAARGAFGLERRQAQLHDDGGDDGQMPRGEPALGSAVDAPTTQRSENA
jgi:hypothetical protein